MIYTNNVHTLRKELGITQDRMAADLEICSRSIGMIENGKQNLSLEMAYRIAAYFGRIVPEVFPVCDEASLKTFERLQ